MGSCSASVFRILLLPSFSSPSFLLHSFSHIVHACATHRKSRGPSPSLMQVIRVPSRRKNRRDSGRRHAKNEKKLLLFANFPSNEIVRLVIDAPVHHRTDRGSIESCPVNSLTDNLGGPCRDYFASSNRKHHLLFLQMLEAFANGTYMWRVHGVTGRWNAMRHYHEGEWKRRGR